MTTVVTDLESRIAVLAERAAVESLDFLQTVVDIPSGTLNVAGVRATGALYRQRLDRIGFTTRWVEMPPEMNRAGHLFAEIDGLSSRVLIIGHLDTVLEGERFEVRDGRAYGTGISDMKGNLAAILALEVLAGCGALEGAAVTVALMGDEEEAGRPLSVSRKDLIEAASRSACALAFECCVPGTATVGRRGILSWRLEVHADTGHSSRIFSPGFGAGAVMEAVRIVDAFRNFTGTESMLTLNPSVFLGGTTLEFDSVEKVGTAEGKTNVIAGRALVEGDLRFIANAQRDRAVAAMQEIVAASLPGARAQLSFAEGYPAMAPSEGNHQLMGVLSEVSEALGHGSIVALDPLERGAGDVSFVAPMIASIDGLGASGIREHAPGESMDLEEWPRIVQRAALLVYRLTRR